MKEYKVQQNEVYGSYRILYRTPGKYFDGWFVVGTDKEFNTMNIALREIRRLKGIDRGENLDRWSDV